MDGDDLTYLPIRHDLNSSLLSMHIDLLRILIRLARDHTANTSILTVNPMRLAVILTRNTIQAWVQYLLMQAAVVPRGGTLLIRLDIGQAKIAYACP